MTSNTHTIGLIVERENPDQAKEMATITMCWQILSYYPRGTTFTVQSPVNELTSHAARNQLTVLWGAQIQQYTKDLGFIRRQVLRNMDHALEQVDFRSACYRVGAPDGWPVRIYDQQGHGVIWASNLTDIMEAPGIRWLVLVEVRE